MEELSVSQIREVFGRDDLDEAFCIELSRLLDMHAVTFCVDTPIRRVRFLAQAVAETGVMRNGEVRVRENLNYSADALVKLSRYFRNNPRQAKKHGRTREHRANQRMIANLWYADANRSSRLRLGNVKEGDGWLYRGAGLFQSTGRENITKDLRHIEKMTGIRLMDENGDVFEGVLSNYTMSIMLGMAHWHRTGMYRLQSTNAITHRINAGLPDAKKRQRLATALRLKGLLMA
jgi:predicted chitinase